MMLIVAVRLVCLFVEACLLRYMHKAVSLRSLGNAEERRSGSRRTRALMRAFDHMDDTLLYHVVMPDPTFLFARLNLCSLHRQ